jgi:MFS family permease
MPLSLLMLVLIGIVLQLVMNLCNAILQTQVKDSVRGRVMSIYSLTHFGFMPIGGLFAGMMAEFAGEPVTIILSSGIFLLSVSILWIKAPQLRRLK